MHKRGELGTNSGSLLLLGDLLVSEPLLTLGILVDLGETLKSNGSLRLLDILGLNLLSIGVGEDGRVDLLVEIGASLDLVVGEALVPVLELSGILLLVFLLELGHVVEDVVTEDSILVLLSLELGILLLGFTSSFTSLVNDLLDSGLGVTRESLGRVGDVEATISSTLHAAEDTSTSGSSVDTNIKEGLEGSLVLILFVGNVEVVTSDLRVRLVFVGKSNLLQQSSGEEETGAVSSRVVGETSGETVSLKLGRFGGTHHSVTVHVGENDLEDELGVGTSNDKSVLLSVVLVLGLKDESMSGEVISLSLSSTSRLGLNSRVISFVLYNFYESHDF